MGNVLLGNIYVYEKYSTTDTMMMSKNVNSLFFVIDIENHLKEFS